jgi:hypothetical protein
MALLNTAAARGAPYCWICGAAHKACGGPTSSVPVDAPKKEVVMAGPLRRVEVRPGVVLKLTEEDAKRHEASLVESKRTDDAEAKKRADDVETKKRSTARNKTRAGE